MMLVRLELSWKALFPMLVRELGNVMLAIFQHPEKASSPISVSPMKNFSSLKEVMVALPWNSVPISVTAMASL